MKENMVSHISEAVKLGSIELDVNNNAAIDRLNHEYAGGMTGAEVRWKNVDNFYSFSESAHLIDPPVDVEVIQGMHGIFKKLKRIVVESSVHVAREQRIHFSVYYSGGCGLTEPIKWSGAFGPNINMRLGPDHPLEIVQGRVELPKSFKKKGRMLETFELGGEAALKEYLDRSVEKGDASIIRPESGEVWFLPNNVIHRIVDTSTTNLTHDFWIPK